MSKEITDIISYLPKDLIEEILCLLSSRDIMRLSVLSKIWREEICSSLQFLNLDLSDFGWQLTKLDDASLENFVNVVLQYYDASHLNVFNLICRDKYLEKYTRSFITETIKFNPRIVNLDVPISYTNTFSSIFTCKSVKELNLTCQLRHGILATPEVVSLLNLKKLCLTEVVIGGESFSKLLSGCPVIEDLSLTNCTISGDSNIYSTTLKFLLLEGCTYFRLSICAPNLISLEYASSGNIITLLNLSSLVFAHVTCCYRPYGTVIGLSSVQHLDLCGTKMKVYIHLILFIFFSYFCYLFKERNRHLVFREYLWLNFYMCSI